MQHARWNESALAASAWSLPAYAPVNLLPAVLEGLGSNATGCISSFYSHKLHRSTSRATPLHYALLVAILALLWPSTLPVARLSSSFQASIFQSGHGDFLPIFEALDSLLDASRLVCRIVAAHTYRPVLAIFRNERLYCQHKKRFYMPKRTLGKLQLIIMGSIIVHLKQLVGLRAALAITAILHVYMEGVLSQAKRGSAMRQDYGDLKTGLTYVLAIMLGYGSVPLAQIMMIWGGFAIAFIEETRLRETAWKAYLVSYWTRRHREDSLA